MENQEKPDLGTRIENSITGLFSGSDGTAQAHSPSPQQSQQSSDKLPKVDMTDESNLKMIAGVILTFGILSSLVLFFNIAYITIPSTAYTSAEAIFNWTGFVVCLATCLSSIGFYYFLIVISNISISLKQRNS